MAKKQTYKKRAGRKKLTKREFIIAVLIIVISAAYQFYQASRFESYSMENVPAFDGMPFVVIDENQPSFTNDELTDEAYEYYSDLDYLDRCGVTEACIGPELMPTEERGDISAVKPTGWVQNFYDFVV